MRSYLPLITVVVAAAALAACERPQDPRTQPAPAKSAKPAAAAAKTQSDVVPAKINTDDLKGFKVLPAKFESDKNAITDAKVKLGRILYFDTRLSKNHDLSCNSCHGLDTYGVDGKPFSLGHKGQLGGRNSPTVYNAGAHVAQFWDGRADTLEEQAKGPILNPVEMAMPDEKTVVETLESIPDYEKLFKEAFPEEKEPISYDNMAKAIGAFERGLVTPSRFDKYLGGEQSALNDAERAGLSKFISTGCQTCHDGAALGGTTYKKLGEKKAFASLKDFGRFDHTKKEEDKFFFRVPSLRNVAKTGPYFHDGSIKSLEEAVDKMAVHQLGVQLKEEEVKSIVTFLNALTGELPAAYIKAPELPKSGEKTRKADPN